MEVKTIYKRTAIAVLILSFIHLLIFNQNNVEHRFLLVFISNAGYHMFYHLLTLIGRKKIVAIMSIFASIAYTAVISIAAFKTYEFDLILGICVAAGLFLGGMRIFEKIQTEN